MFCNSNVFKNNFTLGVVFNSFYMDDFFYIKYMDSLETKQQQQELAK